MEGTILQTWEKEVGIKTVAVIKEVTTRWVGADYLGNEPHAILGLGVMAEGNVDMGLLSWVGKEVSQSFRYEVCVGSLQNFIELFDSAMEDVRALSDNPNQPFLKMDAIASDDGTINVAVGILRLEKFTYYFFDTARDEDDLLRARALLFELGYVICRALAPQSNGAFLLVNRLVFEDCFDEIGLYYPYRQAAIAHAEEAFCHNLFSSIKEWRAQ